jgi:hypothetical protein
MTVASSHRSTNVFALMMQQWGVLFWTTNVHGAPRAKYFRKYAYGRSVPDTASAPPAIMSCGIYNAASGNSIVSTPSGSK